LLMVGVRVSVRVTHRLSVKTAGARQGATQHLDAAARARQVLVAGGPRLILGLPAAALRPELEPAVSAIFRHLLEDPATLQAAMEAEIRSALAGWAGNARGGAGAGAYDGAPPAWPALPEVLVCELL